jgi:hypothetical protein
MQENYQVKKESLQDEQVASCDKPGSEQRCLYTGLKIGQQRRFS